MATRIVIAGGGFAALAVARRLEQRLGQREAEITLISRENFSVFTPMLPEVSSGALDTRHIVTPIRAQLRRTRFILGDVTAIDAPGRRIRYVHALTGESSVLSYDEAVLTVGSAASTFGLPGVAEHAFFLKTLEDAARLRNHLIWLLESADASDDETERRRFLTIVIVGGGFTGVETAGEIAELFRSIRRFYTRVRRREMRVMLVEAGHALLPGLPPKMGDYAAKALAKRGIDILRGSPVSSVSADGLDLSGGIRIESRTIVWSAGVRPEPLAGMSDLPLRKNGAIEVTPELRVKDRSDVWASGDCAAIPDGAGGFYPPTAQHALREGSVLADNIVAKMRGRKLRTFRYHALGMMASLGARKAVAQLPGDRVLTGFPAWFLWRTYYLLRLPGLDRKVRVAFDWTLDLFFPRDIAELRLYTRQTHGS